MYAFQSATALTTGKPSLSGSVSGQSREVARPRTPLRISAQMRRARIVARVDRSDEGFVSCSACGSDELVALSSFARRGDVTVKCSSCGRRWSPDRDDVFTLDGSANIVTAADRKGEDGEDLFGGSEVKLFVGNLNPKTTKDALSEAFSEFGSVKDAVVVFDRVTGRSRGFGFVTMINASSAEAAIGVMHQSSSLGGRRLSVRIAEDSN
jgi:cold-inducible RNA-binding protein